MPAGGGFHFCESPRVPQNAPSVREGDESGPIRLYSLGSWFKWRFHQDVERIQRPPEFLAEAVASIRERLPKYTNTLLRI